MPGVKTTITTAPPTAAHAAAGQKAGFNVAGLTAELAEQVSESIFLLKEIIKTFPSGSLTAAGAISTASPNIAMALPIPPWVVAGMPVFDVTAGHLLGTVSSGAGTTTLVLGANSAFVGSGSNDILQITDANLATYQALVASLS
jgi:hypothetical protein